jgi:hypothetical protein
MELYSFGIKVSKLQRPFLLVLAIIMVFRFIIPIFILFAHISIVVKFPPLKY